MDCIYFYKGSPDSGTCDQHANKHERSFHCSQPGCHITSIGCKTAKDLERHMISFHATANHQPAFPCRWNGDPLSISKAIYKGDLEATEYRLEESDNKLHEFDFLRMLSEGRQRYLVGIWFF